MIPDETQKGFKPFPDIALGKYVEGKKIGYVRVSAEEQNPDRQIEIVKDAVDKLFIDKASGKSTDRPQLRAMCEFVREGDTLIVASMDRLARNLGDLREIVQALTTRGVCIFFIKEGLTFSGNDSPMATLLLNVMGAFAEFERRLIRERQLEGIALAKLKGVYKGRKKSLSAAQIAELHSRIAAGEQKTSVARDFGISRETLYQYLKASTELQPGSTSES